MKRLLRYLGSDGPSWPYVAPFVVYLLLLAVGPQLPWGPEVSYLLRVVGAATVLLIWSRGAIRLRPSQWLGSVAIGVVVFLIWIGPDALWPGYRTHWLLENALTGRVASSIPPASREAAWFLAFRVAGSAVLVPIIEELFWRAWLTRYLVSRDFWRLPLGASTLSSFGISAVLFATEHGPYWDVGLAAGVIYNLWMIRTRSLADCILAHAVTNGCLAAYVLVTGHWQYWM